MSLHKFSKQSTGHIRIERIQRDINRALSAKLLEMARDKRISPVNIHAISLNRDISSAEVYLLPARSVGDLDAADKAVAEVHAHAPGLRAHLARSLALQRTPRLKFRVATEALEQERIAHYFRARGQ